MGSKISGRRRVATFALAVMVAGALLAGCAGVERVTLRPAGSTMSWSLGVVPHVDTQPCESDSSVDSTLQPAVMPPMSVTVVLKLGATAVDAERVADCVEGLMSEGTISLMPPGCVPVLGDGEVLACSESTQH